jgi:hypothetical protein
MMLEYRLVPEGYTFIGRVWRLSESPKSHEKCSRQGLHNGEYSFFLNFISMG